MYNEMSVTLISVSHDTAVSNKHEERTRHYYVINTEDYPLRKSVVDHDQQRVEALGRRKIGDEIARDLLKRAGARGGNRDKGGEAG